MTSPDPNRSYTRRLSQLLSSEDGTLALALLQKLKVHDPAGTLPPPPRPDGETIGIWRRDDGGAFRRDPERRAEWRYWADIDSLPLRPGRRQLAVLGESVARGYFFDPHITFASLMADLLHRVPGLEDVDILDLARTNATHRDLAALLLEVALARPSALIVFAANNWNIIDLSPEQSQQLADAVRAGGYAAAGALYRTFVVQQAEATLDVLAKVAADVDAPVTVVLPEFNLVDWVDERSLVCPVLPGNDLESWLRLRQRAVQALGSGRTAEATRLAVEMTELDGGTSPVSQLLLARSIASERPQDMEQALVRAKDAVVGLFTIQSPRILASVQEAVRRKAAEHGFLLVDLPQELRAAADGAPPDRRFFLDYCHLNFEGLSRAAAAAVDRLTEPLGGTRTPIDELLGALPEPDTAQLVIAHFLAAVHNAHYGQPTAILRHHLEQALALDPGVAARMEDYLDYQTRVAPHWMCASYERSAAAPELARYLEVSDARLTGKLADHDLRDAIVAALEDAGRQIEEKYRSLLIAEHADETVDLLTDAARAASFRERLGTGIRTRAAYLFAEDLTSEFHLVVDEPADTELTVTWRLPEGTPERAEVSLCVNGEPCGSRVVGTAWETATLTVPASLLHRGRNVLRIDWPLRSLPGDSLLAADAARLERGILPQSLPAYGHVFFFTARRSAGATS